MTDAQLTEAWTTLDPTRIQRLRMDARVAEWLDAHDTSLAAEWLGLVRVAPLTTFSLAAASAVAIAALPAMWLAALI